MWRSPALRGAAAKWEKVGPVFTSPKTVLADGHLQLRGVDFRGQTVRGRQHVVSVDQSPAAEEGLPLPQND